MAEPTCRACYAKTLTDAQRERFYAEPVTSCIYWCDEHQGVIDAVSESLRQIPYMRATLRHAPFALANDVTTHPADQPERGES